jgi:GTPase-associated protein 1
VDTSRTAIHQALHGYRDGHRLLASSTEIKPADRRVMLGLSDSPDAKAISADDPLLAGYPLPSREFYVLAMTWPAKDVPRPGCVWTHSLLLPAGVLGAPNPAAFLHLFRKPSADEGYEAYGHGLRAEPSQGAEFGDSEIAATLLWALHEPPTPPVDIRTSAVTGVGRNEILLALWGQLWPKLRMEFSFAVAPSVARRLDLHLFDLQITERPQSGSWEQRAGEPLVRTVIRPLTQEIPLWCAALAADLARAGELRAFLWDVGESLPPSRIGVWALAMVWAAFSNRSGPSGLASALGAVARAFPEPHEATELKLALLGPSNESHFPFEVQQESLLAAIARADLPTEDLVGLELDQRSAALAECDPAAAELLASEILNGKVSRPGKEILSGLGAGLPDTVIRTLGKNDIGLLALIARDSDPLRARPVFWSSVFKDDVWPVLGSPRTARRRRKAMLRAIVEADAKDFAEAATEDWADGVELTLELIASDGLDPGKSTVVQGLPVDSVALWLKENGPCPSVAKALLENWKPKQLGRLPVGEWKALFDEGESLRDFVLVLLFAASTDPGARLGAERAVLAFEQLLARMSQEQVSRKAIKQLTKIAEGRGAVTKNPADAAAYLLASGFEAANWKASSMLSIKDETAFRSVLEQDLSSQLIDALTTAAEGSETRPGQREAIFRALMKTKDVGLLHSVLDRGRRYIPWLS